MSQLPGKSAPKPIRQTKTSIYRMAKANPLMVGFDNKINVAGKEVNLPPAVFRYEKKAQEEESNWDSSTTLPPAPMPAKLSLSVPKSTSFKFSLKPNLNKTTVEKSTNNTTTSGAIFKMPFNCRKKPTGFDFNLNESVDKMNAKMLQNPSRFVAKSNTNQSVHKAGPKESFKVTKGFNLMMKESVSETNDKLMKNQRKIITKSSSNQSIDKTLPKQSTKLGRGFNLTQAAKFENEKPVLTDKINNKPKLIGSLTKPTVKNEQKAKENTVPKGKTLGKPFKKPLPKSDLCNYFESIGKTPNSAKKPISSLRRTLSNVYIQSKQTNAKTSTGSASKFNTPLKVQFNKLEKPLNQWLKNKNKNMNAFPNLKAMGLDLEEDKENLEPQEMPRSASYENLQIEEPKNQQQVEPQDLLLNGILNDLFSIINEGYSVEQCENWLQFIETNYENVKEKSMYWECRAAIEKNRGNYFKAMQHYQTSLEKTKENSEPSGRMESLLDKFRMLKLDDRLFSGKTPKSALGLRRNLEEAKNIINSTSIQFAIKDERSKLSATPVRRSTRKSRKQFTTTPGKSFCESMTTLDKSVLDSLSFSSNKFL